MQYVQEQKVNLFLEALYKQYDHLWSQQAAIMCISDWLMEGNHVVSSCLLILITGTATEHLSTNVLMASIQQQSACLLAV